MKKPTVHLIEGFVGSGKSTFAKKLERETGAVRYTPDEWMTKRHGSNPPEDKFREYEMEIYADIKSAAALDLAAGRDVILDFGFWSRTARDEIRAWVTAHGGVPKLYNVTAPEDIMRARVQKRTAEMPPGALFIDDNAFDLFKTRYEPAMPDEDFITIQTG
jgi:predicted kinase